MAQRRNDAGAQRAPPSALEPREPHRLARGRDPRHLRQSRRDRGEERVFRRHPGRSNSTEHDRPHRNSKESRGSVEEAGWEQADPSVLDGREGSGGRTSDTRPKRNPYIRLPRQCCRDVLLHVPIFCQRLTSKHYSAFILYLLPWRNGI